MHPDTPRERRVSVCLTASERDALDALAAAEHRTLSQCVRLALLDWFSARAGDTTPVLRAAQMQARLELAGQGRWP